MTLTDILDIQKIRADFPILDQEINGKKLVYFDNAATTQKPTAVINAISHYYNFDNANIHRGIHTLAERATRDFEASREAIRQFLGASSTEEIIFTSGTTQGINLVASLSIKVTKLLFRVSNTIPILYLGKCFAKKKVLF